MTDLVRLERRGSVVILTLNRPKALNALDRATLEALIERTRGVAADAAVRSVVVTGEGRAFAAGADIAAMREMTSAPKTVCWFSAAAPAQTRPLFSIVRNAATVVLPRSIARPSGSSFRLYSSLARKILLEYTTMGARLTVASP